MTVPSIAPSRSSASIRPPECFSDPIDNFDPSTPTYWACVHAVKCESKRDDALNELTADRYSFEFQSFGLSHSSSFDHRLRPETFLTAIAMAFF